MVSITEWHYPLDTNVYSSMLNIILASSQVAKALINSWMIFHTVTQFVCVEGRGKRKRGLAWALVVAAVRRRRPTWYSHGGCRCGGDGLWACGGGEAVVRMWCVPCIVRARVGCKMCPGEKQLDQRRSLLVRGVMSMFMVTVLTLAWRVSV